ncbi:MAG: phosphate ABC transporter ATP-binding protein [Oligoflexia bacterium]|nr:phosphate ABC transporter ATP-binding protein [Oligoflexia bacterium]MBF0364937.1 phosphate ABC transporter ATP-binding protein [Oligoflexia bacterium]
MKTLKSILTVDKLHAYFGDHQVVKGISSEYFEKTITAIIGPSGCGKSTYLRCLNRLHETVPDAKISGDVVLNGQNIYAATSDPVFIRQKVGMVFQRPNPFPAMSIFDNVVIGLKLSASLSKQQLTQTAEECLKKAALWDEVKDKLHREGTSLSGGQQQRLCIARAIALNPQVLLMDEPTSALDPIAAAKVEELMKDLCKEFTVILVTHNMGQASRVSDYTTFLMLGELIEHAATAELFTNPKHQLTEDYIMRKFGS